MDPFDLLGIEPHFALDLASVEKRYRELSRTLHPDKYAGRPASERRMALSRAIEVNEAWRLVRDPIRRGEALFKRSGIPIGEGQENPASPALLMEMMEAREALSDARASKDPHTIERLAGEMKTRETSLVRKLGEALDSSQNPDSLRLCLPLLSELRYVRRFLEEASAAEDELT